MKRRRLPTFVLALALLGFLVAGSSLAGKATHTVTITSGPSGTVASTDATFTFASTDSATFTCSLDGATATGCGSGRQGTVSYHGLSQGAHRFSVFAAVARTVHTARADRSWTVAPPPPPRDTTPPETIIESAVAGPVLADNSTLPLSLGTVPLNIATFTFRASEQATFTCSLDGRTFPCTSPLRNPHLTSGAHRFDVRAVDLAGNADPTPAMQAWTVGPVVGQVIASPAPLKIRRKKLVPSRDLLIGKVHTTPSRAEEEEDEYDAEDAAVKDEPGDNDCRVVECGPRETGAPQFAARTPTSVLVKPTPPLSRGPYIVGTSGNDPNIAASSTHLVVTNNGVIRFFDKSGKLVKKDKNGNPVPNSITAWQFFWPAWFNPANPPTINDGLKLPSGLKCDPTIDLFASLTPAQTAATANCMGTVYDTRVIFDEFRKRFWLVSAVRNASLSDFWKLPIPQRVGRRDRLMIAVSSSENPTDPWYLYGFSGAVDQGACNDLGSNVLGPPPICPGTKYRPLHGTDYPAIGISPDYFVVAINAGNSNPWVLDVKNAATVYGYTSISVFDATALANGGCAQTCSWQYGPFKAGIVTSSGTVVFSGDPFYVLTQPAVQHDTAPGGSTVMASVIASHDLVAVFSFSKQQKYIAPPLHVAWVPVSPAAGGVKDMPQRPLAPVTNPVPLRVSAVGSSTLKAVLRDDKLYVTWQDCKIFDPDVQTECSTAVRFLVLNLDESAGGVSAGVSRDATLGQALLSYGNSAVEVNKLGDAVVVYNRSGASVFAQARYTALFHGESGVPDGFTLKLGNFPFGTNAVPGGPTSVGNLDTGGIAVEPFDDVGIWIAHAFSKKNGSQGQFDTAIGKVFGTLYADLSLSNAYGLVIPKRLTVGGGFQIGGEVSNGGDGRSRAVAGHATLVAGRVRVGLGSFAVKPLAPGATARFRLLGRLPKTVKPGRYELEVTLAGAGKEYSAKNNVGRRAVVVGPTRKGAK